MPLGFERLNERTQRSNALINFIKPLNGPDKALAQDFLERIAAISYPIMKAHHIAVMSLEEHAPNLEFVGRNFNAGEVIQLVLRAPYTGQWLPFRHVQMVMMHELAHCKQMNHSGAFWKVRDAYAEELRGLWGKGYTGEGFWSRGQMLLSGRYTTDTMPEAAAEPRSLCGGTFRTRRGKRKRKEREGRPKVSYAERQQRRILKKFGVGGVALGDDGEGRVKLEGGKKAKGKPRVAGSARGRELRAAAALARVQRVKEEAEEAVVKQEEDSGSETESEYEGDGQQVATDLDGRKMLDPYGHGMVRVCEEEDSHDENARKEMEELRQVDLPFMWEAQKRRSPKTAPAQGPRDHPLSSEVKVSPDKPTDATKDPTNARRAPATAKLPTKFISPPRNAGVGIGVVADLPPAQGLSELWHSAVATACCSVCSLVNDKGALTCMACANVLEPEKMSYHWRCQSLSCRGGLYVNAGDCGVCGVCGAAKPA